jgi:hypothetical protein
MKIKIAKALALLAAEKKPTKLSRLVPRNTVVGTLDDLEQGQRELDDEMRAGSENKLACQR